ncbi:MAG: ubiquinone biosynthesis regulatory protein kinase UbiB [Candidatus Macondimonas sp.]|jgi:ubiquinone biosynthesis protein
MYRVTLRILQATRVVLRYRLDEVLFYLPQVQPFGWIRYGLPWHWRQEKRLLGMRLRLALEELGPVAIKLGQALATRRDLLPPEMADELARLQDRVPPFPGAIARRILEETYGAPLEQVFAEFSETPLAAASIAQVHAARLKDGREVVVKLLRPGIEQRIRQDLRVMYLLADFVQRYVPDGQRLRAREVIEDYEKTILDELDLVREGANAAQTRRNFEDRPILYVPLVHWELTRRHVLVMERIHGIPISDIATLKARGVNFRFLAERGVEIFFTQVFRHNFFHADMHAGNIFVDTRDPARPGYIAVDFGIVGSLGLDDQRYIAHNIYAFFNGDYRRVAELHVASGWVRPDTRVEDLESVIRSLCEPILFRPFKDIHLDQLLLRLFEIARRFNMEVQPQLVLLQKTLVQIEGLGRQLYPDLDLWTTAKPFMERWMHEQLGVRGVYQQFKANLPDLAQRLPMLPLTLDHALQAITELPARQQALTQQLQRLENQRTQRRGGGWMLMGGTLLLTAGGLAGMVLGQSAAIGQNAWPIAAILGVCGLFSLRRARRV